MAANHPDESFVAALHRADPEAAQRLWEEFVRPLANLARKKLHAIRVPDASGIVQEAMNSFFQGVKRGAYPQLNDRSDLWRLLVVITARKAAHCVRDEYREKREGGKVHGASALSPATADDFNGLEQVLGREPTPEFSAQWAEAFERRIAQLEPIYQEVALARMAGHSNAEIASRLDVAERTIERRLNFIRRLWSERDTDDASE